MIPDQMSQESLARLPSPSGQLGRSGMMRVSANSPLPAGVTLTNQQPRRALRGRRLTQEANLELGESRDPLLRKPSPSQHTAC